MCFFEIHICIWIFCGLGLAWILAPPLVPSKCRVIFHRVHSQCTYSYYKSTNQFSTSTSYLPLSCKCSVASKNLSPEIDQGGRAFELALNQVRWKWYTWFFFHLWLWTNEEICGLPVCERYDTICICRSIDRCGCMRAWTIRIMMHPTPKWGDGREAGNQRHTCRTLMTTTVQLIKGYARPPVVPDPDAQSIRFRTIYLQMSRVPESTTNKRSSFTKAN
jgi:hypothetical protein